MAAKKSTAKKSAKKVAKKSTTRKAVVKKSTAKKSVAKKSVAKKSAAKPRKATVRKATKKSTAQRSTITVPPVPVGGARPASRANVTTAPAKPATAPAPQRPVAPRKSGGSSRVVLLLTVAIVILGLIVWSKSSTTSDTASTPTATETPAASESPTAEPTSEPTPEPTKTMSSAVSSGAAPERFIGNFRNGGETLLLTWRAPADATGITGYNVEVRPANGEWASVEVVGADVFKYELQKSSSDSWSQFRVSAVYPDGQSPAKIFGFAGQWSK